MMSALACHTSDSIAPSHTMMAALCSDCGHDCHSAPQGWAVDYAATVLRMQIPAGGRP